jgi:hypothetical protein
MVAGAPLLGQGLLGSSLTHLVMPRAQHVRENIGPQLRLALRPDRDVFLPRQRDRHLLARTGSGVGA